MSDCVFCGIIAGTDPATFLYRWSDAIAIVPLNPVTPGHALIIPRPHIAGSSPDFHFVAGLTAIKAAEYAQGHDLDYNLILNQGPNSSQTIGHMHWHYVPRRSGDGLQLPWTVTT